MRFNIIGEDVRLVKDGEPDYHDAIVISEDAARRIAELVIHPKFNAVNEDYLMDYVCLEFGVNRKDLFTRTRKHEVVVARQLIFYVLYRTSGHLSLSKVGSLFKRHHATVLHSIKQVDMIIETKDILYYNHVMKILEVFCKPFKPMKLPDEPCELKVS